MSNDAPKPPFWPPPPPGASPPPKPPPPPPPPAPDPPPRIVQADARLGLVDRLVDIVKGLTLTNVLILALLIILIVPLYLAWRVLNDQDLQGKLFNTYSELEAPSDCLLTFQQAAGGSGHYVIRAILAERPAETWYISTRIRFKPDDKAMYLYCAASSQLIDFMRDPNNTAPPVYPGSDRRIVPVPAPRHPRDDSNVSVVPQ